MRLEVKIINKRLKMSTSRLMFLHNQTPPPAVTWAYFPIMHHPFREMLISYPHPGIISSLLAAFYWSFHVSSLGGGAPEDRRHDGNCSPTLGAQLRSNVNVFFR